MESMDKLIIVNDAVRKFNCGHCIHDDSDMNPTHTCPIVDIFRRESGVVSWGCIHRFFHIIPKEGFQYLVICKMITPIELFAYTELVAEAG